MVRQNDKDDAITSSELKKILEVNEKAIEINIEVEKQNETVIERLDEIKNISTKIQEEQYEISSDEKIHNIEVKSFNEQTSKNIEGLYSKGEELTEVISEKIKKVYENQETIIKAQKELDKKYDDLVKTLWKLGVILTSPGIAAAIKMWFFK